MKQDIQNYNNSKTDSEKLICKLLYRSISSEIDKEDNSENKLWHAAPVWFLNGNPVVGYDVQKASVRLLFWSGQSFKEPGLEKTGSFKAAEIKFTQANQINSKKLKLWLTECKDVQWDYKNIVKRRGKLERI